MNIAIASGKGGTGKTTLASNLASLLSKNTKNQLNKKIILVDLDVEEPNSGLFIKGKLTTQEDKFRAVPMWNNKKCTFCEQCKSFCNFNAIAVLPNSVLIFPELCHSCFACTELCPDDALKMTDRKIGTLSHYKLNDLVFIESRLEIGEPSAVPLIKQTKEYVNKKFSGNTIIIFDSPPGTSCPVIESVKNMDFVVLVTEPTPFGLHDLKLAIETVKKLNRKFAVVINKYGIGNNDVDKYCEKNKIPIIGRIPDMKKIAELYSRGKLLYDEIIEVKEEIENIFSEVTTLCIEN